MNTTTATMPHVSHSKAEHIASWIIRIVLALAFVAAGTAKLLGAPMMVQTFHYVGFGQWLRYVTGALEIAGAIGLFIPRLVGFAAFGLGLIMIGAVTAHALVLPATGIPAVILGVLAFILAAIHRREVLGFLTA